MSKLARQFIFAVLPRPVAIRLWTGRQYRRYAGRYPEGERRPHPLRAPLIVSLTSFPPRYPTLHLTLRSLLRQDTVPDRIVLWLARGDEESLPAAVRELLDGRVELRLVDDVRSYKKLVYALGAFPEAYIATADDDVFYKPSWLTELVDGQAGTKGVITCLRAHRLEMGAGGALARYADWGWDVQDDAAHAPSIDLMPTGIGGVLYPPGCFHPNVTERELYERYAPSADDLWFYWCARRAGALYRKVGPRFVQMTWDFSQASRLYDDNMLQNDAQISALVNRFGNPLLMPQGIPAVAVSE
ncbi:MAG: glycosyltransferase [Novosphingobium sp.]|nr:glycosyltransferase [Novosphingobium sp.]